MPDPIFANQKLADIYDVIDYDRGDLELYCSLARSFNSRSIVDIGCGTGTFACKLAEMGFEVTGIDPAAASVKVAKRKPHSDVVSWFVGSAQEFVVANGGNANAGLAGHSEADVGKADVDNVNSGLAGGGHAAFDFATMTGNVGQVFVEADDWLSCLESISKMLKPNGKFVFEVRDPSMRAWEQWNRENSYAEIGISGVGLVRYWVDLLDVCEIDSIQARARKVSFRWTYEFVDTNETLISDSTLVFREREDVENSLRMSGFRFDDVLDAPDRHGMEFVFVCSPT